MKQAVAGEPFENHTDFGERGYRLYVLQDVVHKNMAGVVMLNETYVVASTWAGGMSYSNGALSTSVDGRICMEQNVVVTPVGVPIDSGAITDTMAAPATLNPVDELTDAVAATTCLNGLACPGWVVAYYDFVSWGDGDLRCDGGAALPHTRYSNMLAGLAAAKTAFADSGAVVVQINAVYVECTQLVDMPSDKDSDRWLSNFQAAYKDLHESVLGALFVKGPMTGTGTAGIAACGGSHSIINLNGGTEFVSEVTTHELGHNFEAGHEIHNSCAGDGHAGVILDNGPISTPMQSIMNSLLTDDTVLIFTNGANSSPGKDNVSFINTEARAKYANV